MASPIEKPRRRHDLMAVQQAPRTTRVRQQINLALNSWKPVSRKKFRPRDWCEALGSMCFATNVFQDPQRQLNPFVFDINVQTSAGRKIMKRVLLDTGSDLNLISHSAHREIESKIRHGAYSVHSLAGQTAIVGQTNLSWNFLTHSPQPELPSQTDDFFVLARTESAGFDCILGHTWIWNHINVFSALMNFDKRHHNMPALYGPALSTDAIGADRLRDRRQQVSPQEQDMWSRWDDDPVYAARLTTRCSTR